MAEKLSNHLDNCKSDTEPSLLIIEGPTWTDVHPWDEISRDLLDTLQRCGWRVRRCIAGVRVFSPFLREA